MQPLYHFGDKARYTGKTEITHGGLIGGLKVIGVAMPLRDSMAPREGFGLARETAGADTGSN